MTAKEKRGTDFGPGMMKDMMGKMMGKKGGMPMGEK